MTDANVARDIVGRKPIGKRKRFHILQRDGFRCQYCGAEATHSRLHVDHKYPVTRGGPNGDWNLVTACADCNLGKSDRTLGPSRVETLAAKALADFLGAGFSIDILIRGLRLVQTGNGTLLDMMEVIDHPDGVKDLEACERAAANRGVH